MVLVVGLVFYLMGGRYVSTDDAYIQAARVDISTEVSGRIAEIDVRDNQHVRKGEVLFRLDTPRFRIAVADARAQLAAAMIKVPALQAVYRQRLADQAAAQKQSGITSKRELARQTELQARGISSRAQLDQAKQRFSIQPAATGGRRAADRQRAGRSGRRSECQGRKPADRAPGPGQRSTAPCSTCPIPWCKAPMDGIVAKVDQIQVGDHVNTATPLFALMSDHDIWVEANFKETDLTYMRPGQKATFAVDAFPGQDLHRQGAFDQPRHRFELLAAAAGKFLRQLGEGGAAPAGAAFHRRSMTICRWPRA